MRTQDRTLEMSKKNNLYHHPYTGNEGVVKLSSLRFLPKTFS